jgi:hypothetical protein
MSTLVVGVVTYFLKSWNKVWIQRESRFILTILCWMTCVGYYWCGFDGCCYCLKKVVLITGQDRWIHLLVDCHMKTDKQHRGWCLSYETEYHWISGAAGILQQGCLPNGFGNLFHYSWRTKCCYCRFCNLDFDSDIFEVLISEPDFLFTLIIIQLLMNLYTCS